MPVWGFPPGVDCSLSSSICRRCAPVRYAGGMAGNLRITGLKWNISIEFKVGDYRAFRQQQLKDIRMRGHKIILIFVSLAAAIFLYSLGYSDSAKQKIAEEKESDSPEVAPSTPRVTIDWSGLRCAPPEKDKGKPKHDMSLLYKEKKITSMTLELTKEEYERLKKNRKADSSTAD